MPAYGNGIENANWGAGMTATFWASQGALGVALWNANRGKFLMYRTSQHSPTKLVLIYICRAMELPHHGGRRRCSWLSVGSKAATCFADGRAFAAIPERRCGLVSAQHQHCVPKLTFVQVQPKECRAMNGGTWGKNSERFLARKVD